MKRIVPSAMYGDYPAQLAHLTVRQGGCWEFTGFILPQGYGQLGRNLLAHRIAWEVANGRPVPTGLVIDHTCHNADLNCRDDSACRHRRCVNPAHLEAVPQRLNLVRGKGFAGSNAAKTHCVHGHAFTAGNTYVPPKRYGRQCRTCRHARLAALRPYYAEKRRADRLARAAA